MEHFVRFPFYNVQFMFTSNEYFFLNVNSCSFEYVRLANGMQDLFVL